MLQHLTIPRGPINLAADLHLPDNADSSAPLRAVVLSTPGSSVKEQIGANYASRLAARGIAALVFDPAHQGQSEGEPRDLEDPYRRGEDISYAIEVLTTTPASTRSASASSASAPVGLRRAHRPHGPPHQSGRHGRPRQHRRLVPRLPARRSGRSTRRPRDARTEEARSGQTTRVNWLPDTLEDATPAGLTDIDTTQAITYYRTERGGNEHSTNRRLLRSDSLLLATTRSTWPIGS